MTIPNTGLNAFRTACADIVDTGIAGTGTTAPAASDTALETAVGATETSASVTEGQRSFQTSHTVSSTTATGNDFAEWGVLDASDVLLSRAVTAAVSHTSNDEITKITTFNVVNQ